MHAHQSEEQEQARGFSWILIIRAASASPAIRSAANFPRHFLTVATVTPTSAATRAFGIPSAQAGTMRARFSSLGVTDPLAQWVNSARSPPDRRTSTARGPADMRAGYRLSLAISGAEHWPPLRSRPPCRVGPRQVSTPVGRATRTSPRIPPSPILRDRVRRVSRIWGRSAVPCAPTTVAALRVAHLHLISSASGPPAGDGRRTPSTVWSPMARLLRPAGGFSPTGQAPDLREGL